MEIKMKSIGYVVNEVKNKKDISWVNRLMEHYF